MRIVLCLYLRIYRIKWLRIPHIKMLINKYFIRNSNDANRWYRRKVLIKICVVQIINTNHFSQSFRVESNSKSYCIAQQFRLLSARHSNQQMRKTFPFTRRWHSIEHKTQPGTNVALCGGSNTFQPPHFSGSARSRTTRFVDAKSKFSFVQSVETRAQSRD